MSLHVKLETIRRSRRAQVYMSGELAIGGRTVRITIRDISVNGALIITETPLIEHSQVELTRGALSAIGHLAWVHGRQAGVEFDEPVSAQLLEKTMPKALIRSLRQPSR